MGTRGQGQGARDKEQRPGIGGHGPGARSRGQGPDRARGRGPESSKGPWILSQRSLGRTQVTGSGIKAKGREPQIRKQGG